jgi:hypothetical protein
MKIRYRWVIYLGKVIKYSIVIFYWFIILNLHYKYCKNQNLLTIFAFDKNSVFENNSIKRQINFFRF